MPAQRVGLVVAGAAMLGLLRLGAHTGAGAIWWDFAADPGLAVDWCTMMHPDRRGAPNHHDNRSAPPP